MHTRLFHLDCHVESLRHIANRFVFSPLFKGPRDLVLKIIRHWRYSFSLTCLDHPTGADDTAASIAHRADRRGEGGRRAHVRKRQKESGSVCTYALHQTYAVRTFFHLDSGFGEAAANSEDKCMRPRQIQENLQRSGSVRVLSSFFFKLTPLLHVILLMYKVSLPHPKPGSFALVRSLSSFLRLFSFPLRLIPFCLSLFLTHLHIPWLEERSQFNS